MKEKERFKNILITGTPGSGKTTLFNEIITNIRNVSSLKSCNITGFITKEIREKGIRVGFNIENFSGEKGILAHINNKEGPVVGKYKVNLLDLENIGIKTLKDALNSPDINLVAIDEIGKMEMFHPDFLDLIDKIISSSKILLATISYKNKELLQKLKERNDTYVLDLTYVPKDSMERKNAVQFIAKLVCSSIAN
ncbi:MAG: hypothetical protein H5T85_05210 [Actinobacteria bacterium]|nr:hypothetical protein [Actinomycetota bacterium]